MNKKDVVDVLNHIGLLLELKGELPFKARAYYNAARALEQQEESLENLIESQRLKDIKGIGEAINKKLVELITTGKMEYYEKLKSEVPQGLVEMLKIPGLGPKKIKALHEKLGVSTVGELEYACLENRLLELDGFGQKTQQKILQGIEYIKRYQGQFLYIDAIGQAQELLEDLQAVDGVIRMSIAGALRRKKEITKDIDIVTAAYKPLDIIEIFTSLPQVEEITAKGSTKASVRLKSGIAADLRVVLPEQYSYALHHFTGSKEHNAAMRHRAKGMGIKMNEYGLFKGERLISCADENELFRVLGLDYIPPELRENMGEIEAAEQGRLPKLIEDNDIKGVFHIHTAYSDGLATIADMVQMAKMLGYHYIGISDHSQSVFYAGGLKAEMLYRQWQEIDRLNEDLNDFHIFKGIECDILADGRLDYDEEILSQFDFVIASVHSHFNMPSAQMTRRIITAISNPYVTILGHPTGRLLLAREEYAVDMNAVMDACLRNGVAIELNANPHRLDLDWRLCRTAKEMGLRIAINPDAHNTAGLKDMEYGIGIARKGWLEASDVLNAMDKDEIFSFLHQRKN